ncbi:MAG: hypothetical protein LBM98_09905 [Oscillospiraceae bacterium]|nr:hypothetical protein [Oscillospiraceae bacterium]
MRIAQFYVNPGLLRRVSMVRIASAAAASQRRAGRSPAPAPCAGGRFADTGVWTLVASAHGAGNHPGATRCVPSQEGNGRARARRGDNPRLCGGTPFPGRGQGGTRLPQPSSKPKKPPSVEGGAAQDGGGCPRKFPSWEGCRNPRPTPFPSWEGCRP